MTGFTDLSDLLADAGIKLKRQTAGSSEKIVCPKCGGGRTREASLSVSIDQDGCGAKWKCHRGNCGWTAGGRIHTGDGRSTGRAPPAEEREAQKPKPHPTALQGKPKALYAFFEQRGISAETVDHFGCYVTKHFFFARGDAYPEGEYPAIVFPYMHQGELVNRKYRPPHKEPQMQDKGAAATLFNVDSISEPETDVVWVEGEPDVMAVHEAGFRQVVTLKDGSGDKLLAEDDPKREDDKRFRALATHAELLDGIKRFYIAGDMDAPGMVLREELARRLGRHRCWLVTWRDGCKDAGDVLRKHGPDAIAHDIGAAEPYPIEGLQTLKDDTLIKLHKAGAPATISTGTDNTDAVLRWPTEGRLIVITGTPNHGKTPWARFVMVHQMVQHRRRFLVFSPEMQPWESFAASCAEVFTNKAFWRTRGVPPERAMDDMEIVSATVWLKSRVRFLVADSEEHAPTVQWILDRARMALLQMGLTDIVIDPWNEVSFDRPDGMTETEYLGRLLQMLKAFAQRHGINIWIVAHPQKPPEQRTKGPAPVPGGYSISGSAHWYNKADLGLTVHRPRDVTEIHVWKSKFRRWARKGEFALIEVDHISGRYVDHMPDIGEAKPPAGLFD